MKFPMRVCGVDEAGRGSMLGPLVIAGITISRSKINLLKKQGVRDSKKLSPATRERLLELTSHESTKAIDGESLDITFAIYFASR